MFLSIASLCLLLLSSTIDFSRCEGASGGAFDVPAGAGPLDVAAASPGVSTAPVWDENGYVLFCLCMGRLGNQIAHFLGGLAFAKGINRTLVLPPFRGYKNIPFDNFYDPHAVADYHRVILADEFLQRFGSTKWPQKKRTAMCFQYPRDDSPPCKIEGNPFANFWEELGVRFEKYENFYLPLDINSDWDRDEWFKRFPPITYPLLALRGTPAAYPIREEHIALHRYLRWSNAVVKERDELIAANLPRPFVGIHIRNAADFDNACQGLHRFGPNFMASPQCLGYHGQHGKLTRDLCYPPRREIVQRTAAKVRELKAAAVFVATADDPMLAELRATVGGNVKVVHLNAQPHIDMAILAQADHFIGNCVSSFTAAVRQEREVSHKPSSFFSFPSLLKK